jgi:hypothetical protein
MNMKGVGVIDPTTNLLLYGYFPAKTCNDAVIARLFIPHLPYPYSPQVRASSAY